MVSESGECLAAFYFNNIGCLHYHLGKYNLAAHYLRKAIEENDAALNGYPPLDRGENRQREREREKELAVNCSSFLIIICLAW